jgi:hypothetical protein
MAQIHGRKAYFQVLLDPHRAALIEAEAEKAGIRSTAWIRDAVYSVLERKLPASVYKEAVAQDDASWKASVRRRVEGRTKPKEIEKDSEN